MMIRGMVDRNGMRGGAGLSAVGLLGAYIFDVAVVVAVVAAALGVGAMFGPRASPLGGAYRGVKRAFRLRIPVEPEDAAPPRFAQLLGSLVLCASVALFLAAESDVVAWTLALLVAGLQALLAVTGICVGCQIYLLGKRLTAKGA
jgi:hypothetical protein